VLWLCQSSMASIMTTEGRPDTLRAVRMEKVANAARTDRHLRPGPGPRPQAGGLAGQFHKARDYPVYIVPLIGPVPSMLK
jgi:hypothetical protein